ncbi:MAG: hemolysin III family protein [Bdellovibrio sp.]|nr:hemolysin III family protein [Bdellovibrio sp.]
MNLLDFQKFPKPPKPILRGVSHLLACLCAIVGGCLLVKIAPSPKAIIAAIIYSTSLILLFAMSSLYHLPTWSTKQRQWLRKLDHAAIFFLIAGSTTPFAMIALHKNGNSLLWLIWIGSAIGFFQSLFWAHAPKKVSVVIYILLGWAAIIYCPEFYKSIGFIGFLFLLAGGVAYSVGAFIYAMKWPNPFPKVFGYHEIFHAMVIVAAVSHYILIFKIIKSCQTCI